jgi:micrococcal nuclease
MGRALVASFVAVLGLGLCAQADQRGPTDLVGRRVVGTVVSVVDGDTVRVLFPAKRELRVRIEGIDAPESGEPFSQQARNFARAMMFARQVTVDVRDVDRYGRLVARVTVDAKDIGREIVGAGLACYYRRFATDPTLEKAQREAQTALRGFWAANATKPNCVGREASPALSVAATTQARFVANVASGVYHAASCRNADCKNCTKRFESAQAAQAAGFRPAGDCLRR